MTLDDEARAFAKAHPTREGRTWHLWCGALMYQMCAAYGTIPSPAPASAKLAGDAAGELNPNAKLAPVGAFHYWTIGVDGHVGLDTKGGGTNVFMASAFISESLGNAIGFQSVISYTRGTYPYRGWSMFYGKNGTINVPKLSVAQQWAVDNGIVNKPVNWEEKVDRNVIAWMIYKSRGKI